MPTFVSELTRGGVSQLWDVLGRERYASTPEELRDVVTSGETAAAGIASSWEQISQLLDRGAEGRKLRFLVLELQDVVRLFTWAFPQIRQKVENAAPASDAREEGLRNLSAAARRVAQVREQLGPLAAWLDAPPPPFEPSALSGAGAVEKADGYVSLDEAIARCNANGRT